MSKLLFEYYLDTRTLYLESFFYIKGFRFLVKDGDLDSSACFFGVGCEVEPFMILYYKTRAPRMELKIFYKKSQKSNSNRLLDEIVHGKYTHC